MKKQCYNSDAIKKVLKEITLKAGADEQSATSVSDCLVDASLRGVDSHGIRLFPHYITALNGGRINGNPNIKINKVSQSISLLDADDAFGTLASQEAMLESIKNAEQTGIGVTSVKNSTHFGAAACYGLMAAERDMIGLSFTNASPLLKTTNAKRAFFGANPICFTAPMKNEAPFCYDAATTQITWNSVKKAREQKGNLADNVAFDKDGMPTVDPFEAVFLAPMGDYKGFGLSIVVDILCALLSGMPAGDEVTNMYNNDISDKRLLGQFCVAIDISRFEEINTFKERMQILADKVRAEPREDENTPIYFPGDPEKIFFEDRKIHGIPLPNELADNINYLADKYNVKNKI